MSYMVNVNLYDSLQMSPCSRAFWMRKCDQNVITAWCRKKWLKMKHLNLQPLPLCEWLEPSYTMSSFLSSHLKSASDPGAPNLVEQLSMWRAQGLNHISSSIISNTEKSYPLTLLWSKELSQWDCPLWWELVTLINLWKKGCGTCQSGHKAWSITPASAIPGHTLARWKS